MDGIRVPEQWRFSRIREDVDAGRLWKARDRLQGHLQTNPADQDVLDLLGAVWFAMGDLPQAGRHWWLTERDDEPAATARAAFHERFGTRPLGILRAIPRPADARHYPASVAERLNELLGAAKANGVTWVPRGYTPVHPDWLGNADEAAYKPGLGDRFGPAMVLLAIVGLLLVGLATTIGWVVALLD